MKNKKSMMNLAISNLFLVFLGAGLVIPVLPTLKEQMHFSGTTMGMMISIFAIAQLVASPVAGALSDKIGRKKLLGWGSFAMSCCLLIVSICFFIKAPSIIILSFILLAIASYSSATLII